VTFVCTVTNAVTVVREGLCDAQASLRAYLKSHHRIFELGLEYHQKQINEVRRDVNAQVKAFTTLKPPVIPGIVIELRSVEVLTPAELKQFLDSRRTIEYKHELETAEQRFGHSLTSERQHHDQWLESDRVQYEQTVAAKRQLHDQKLEWDRVRHEQGVSAESQKHELSRRADLSAYERWQRSLDREELTQLSELVGRDPQSALAYAYLAGQMGAGEMADRLEAAQHRKWDLEREERLAALDRGHQERLIELEQKSEQLRWSRERSWDEKKWRREERGYSREDERRKQEIRLEVIRELGKRGYLDMFNIDANRLLDEIAAAAPADQVERQDKPELAAGTKEPDPAAEIDDDIVVREEDVS